jgi:Holliday junction DNA helicase RuvB
MFFNRSKLGILFSHPVKREDKFFADVYGCEDIKKLLRMALESNDSCSILLTGPPASAKTLFLQCLMKLKDSHFIDCSSASKSGIVDYIFENKPKYLLLDELDKLTRKDQTFLLNLMETGIVSETKYNKTRKIGIKTSIFATSNNVEKIIEPLQSRFFVAKLQDYTYEQFYEITTKLLTSDQHNVDEEIARATAETVWRTSKNIRDAIKIARMARSVEDVDWLVTNFLDRHTDSYQPKISADLAAASSNASLGSFTP